MILNYIGHNQWNGFDICNFYNKVVNGDFDKIILFCQNEWQWEAHNPEYWIPLQEHCKKIGKPIHILTGSHEYLYPVQVENTIIDWWDTYWIGKTYALLMNTNKSKKISIDLYSRASYKFHFISMNNRPHEHRCMLIDLIAKHDLFNCSAVSLLQDSVIYKWKHLNFAPRFLTEQKSDWNQYTLPDEYYTSFAQLVSESSGTSIMLSEKTATPLLLGKPFLVAGQMHFHKFLRGLGFQLYEELFDYSFDDEPDQEKRYEMLLQNFKNLSKIPLNKLPNLQKKIAHKLEFNKQKAKHIAYDMGLYPKIALEVIEYYNVTGNMIDTQMIHAYEELQLHRHSEI